LLKPFDDVLAIQNRFRSLLGVKEVENPTYEVKDKYKRYHQKYWLEQRGRGAWDPTFKKIFEKKEKADISRLKRDKTNYSLIGRALKDATGVRAQAHPYETWRWPNVGLLSWSPLRVPTYEKFGLRKLKIINKEYTANLIKKIAMWVGASLVGITILKRRWVYSNWFDGKSSPPRYPRIIFSDEQGFEQYTKPTQLKDGTQIIPKEMKYVISIATEEDYETLKTAPSDLLSAGIRRYGYAKVVQTTSTLAEFIRGLGFNAIPSSGDTCLKTPIAMDAGLGEDGRHGLLITPEYGPRVRLGAVITDLPMKKDNPITFGIHKFCENCRICAEACPGKAIPFGSRTYGIKKNDVDAPTISTFPSTLRWIVNHEKCVSFLPGGCGICRRTCPWNKTSGILHTISKFMGIHGGASTIKTLVKLDSVFGYGKRQDPKEWWKKVKLGPN
jgi:reductive dehalogenase